MPVSGKLTIKISDTIGSISARILDAKRPKAILVLAHGAGAGMDHPFMLSIAEQLAMVSITSLRFNFPYMENGKKRPDVPAIAEKTVEEVLHKTL